MQTETHVDLFHYLPPPQLRLGSLIEWSISHIREVFEARSDDDALRAIESTFAERLEGTVNGAPLSRPQVAQMVLAMRRTAPMGLRVEWRQAQEAPRDMSCRVRSPSCSVVAQSTDIDLRRMARSAACMSSAGYNDPHHQGFPSPSSGIKPSKSGIYLLLRYYERTLTIIPGSNPNSRIRD